MILDELEEINITRILHPKGKLACVFWELEREFTAPLDIYFNVTEKWEATSGLKMWNNSKKQTVDFYAKCSVFLIRDDIWEKARKGKWCQGRRKSFIVIDFFFLQRYIKWEIKVKYPPPGPSVSSSAFFWSRQSHCSTAFYTVANVLMQSPKWLHIYSFGFPKLIETISKTEQNLDISTW